VKVLLIALLALGVASGFHRRPAPEPTIVSQRTDTVLDDMGSLIWERYIDIHNPLDRAVWVYLECAGHLTVNPVGVAGRHTTEITLDNVAPKEACLLNHWLPQKPGVSPPPWTP
jgi:hypothetical protein